MTTKVLQLISLLAILFAGCTEIKVDNFQKWCELISGEDLKDKYAKSWVLKISVSIDENGIRDDFVSFLNRTLLKTAQYKAPKMAWKKDAELHLVNLSSVQNIAPEIMIDKWKKGIKSALQKKHTDFSDICVYETVTRLFNILYIHNMKFDENGIVIKDDFIPIQAN